MFSLLTTASHVHSHFLALLCTNAISYFMVTYGDFYLLLSLNSGQRLYFALLQITAKRVIFSSLDLNGQNNNICFFMDKNLKFHMIDSDSIELLNSLSPTKSRSTEKNKLKNSTFGKDHNSIDQLITSSNASSGYWEDCDSLVTSEYDVFGLNWTTCHQNARIKCNKLKHRPLPDANNHSSLVRTRSFHVKPNDYINKNSYEQYTRDHYSDSILNTYCEDIQLTTNSQNKAANNIRQSSLEDNNHLCIPNDSLSGLDSIESDFLFCQNSCSSVNHTQSCQHISSEVQNVEEKTFKYLNEWDDSGVEDIIKGAEPKTKFEAALRRAEEKNKKRMELITSKDFSTSDNKKMPEWGSPIQIRKNADQSRFMECSLSLDIPVCNSSSPKISRPSDLCREVEEWLESRPSWIDQKHQACELFIHSFVILSKQMNKNNPALQICFLNISEQNLFSSMEAIVAEPYLDNNDYRTGQNNIETNLFSTVNCIKTNDSIQTINSLNDNEISLNSIEDYDDNNSQRLTLNGNSSFVNHKNEKNRTSSSISGRSSLLLAFESSVNLIDLLNEINMYYERLLDQCRQDCFDARSVVYLQELIKNHKRFQTETQIAIIQVPKISAMQAEVERTKISSITPNIATLLRVDYRKFQISKEELIQFSIFQLKVIMNDLHSRIESLNNSLMLSLVERDELHLEQGGKLIALEDIKSWIKELSIRSSIPQVRRQLFLNLSSNLSNNTYSNDIFPKPQTKHNTLPKRPQWMTSLFGRASQRHTLSL
uniref:Schwannomin-interacting protein 1 n=3 Tax=Schistosoma TaxID=6181 RepID=A0A095AM44_SCHHA